jgi:hypothetical protein
LAYLYCDDNRIADLIMQAITLTEDQWDELAAFLSTLNE